MEIQGKDLPFQTEIGYPWAGQSESNGHCNSPPASKVLRHMYDKESYTAHSASPESLTDLPTIHSVVLGFKLFIKALIK